MVVNPKKLLEQITKAEAKELKSLEKWIDEVLEEEFEGEPVYIPVDGWYYDLRKPVADKLCEQYRTQGWTVKLQADQREGDNLVFSYKKKQAKKARRTDSVLRPAYLR